VDAVCADGIARSSRFTAHASTAINRTLWIAIDCHLTGRCRFLCSLRPIRLRCSREALRWQDGMRRPAGCLCKQTPGRRPATPPFRHYERNVRMHQCETKGTAHVHRPTVSPRRARSQQPPRWSAERRASPLGCKASADACGPTSLARRRVPLHPSACRRSAPSSCEEGNTQTSEDECLARRMMHGQTETLSGGP